MRDEYDLTDFVIHDLDGNHIGIGGDDIPDDIHSLPIDYIEIGVRDVGEAKAFYGELFGWTFTDYSDGYASFNYGSGTGGFVLADAAIARGGVLVVLFSGDLEAILDRVRDAGAEISREPFTFPGGRRFHFIDPSGNEFAIWSNESLG